MFTAIPTPVDPLTPEVQALWDRFWTYEIEAYGRSIESPTDRLEDREV